MIIQNIEEKSKEISFLTSTLPDTNGKEQKTRVSIRSQKSKAEIFENDKSEDNISITLSN